MAPGHWSGNPAAGGRLKGLTRARVPPSDAVANSDMLNLLDFIEQMESEIDECLGLKSGYREVRIVLDLLRNHLSGRLITSTALAVASGLSYGTAMRAIEDMGRRGLIVKRPRTSTRQILLAASVRRSADALAGICTPGADAPHPGGRRGGRSWSFRGVPGAGRGAARKDTAATRGSRAEAAARQEHPLPGARRSDLRSDERAEEAVRDDFRRGDPEPGPVDRPTARGGHREQPAGDFAIRHHRLRPALVRRDGVRRTLATARCAYGGAELRFGRISIRMRWPAVVIGACSSTSRS